MTRDEEIWLRGYCAAIIANKSSTECMLSAGVLLSAFKARFPDTDKDLPDFLRNKHECARMD